jgi:uncharacterized protein involved in exopolysaccharide biosynthesis
MTAIAGPTPQPQSESLIGIPMAEMIAIVFRAKRKMILAGLLPLILVLVYIFFLADTIYRAQTELMVKTGREYLADGDGESPQSAPMTTKLEGLNSEIELLTSRPVIEETIRRIGLKNLYPALLEDPPWLLTVEDAAVKKFTTDLSVDVVKMTNLISVTFDMPDKEKAVAVLNKLIEVYQTAHAQVFASNRAATYEESIRRSLGDLQALETQRTAIKLENHIYDITQQRAALMTQRVDSEARLQEAINRKATLEGRIAFINSARPTVAATTKSTTTDKSDETVNARIALTELQQTRAALAARYAPGNPDLQRVNDQIAALQGRMRALQAEAVHTATAPSPLAQQMEQELVMDGAELSPLAAEIERNRKQIADISAELQRLEAADLKLRGIDSQIDALNDSLKTLQGNLQTARARDDMDRARLISVVQVAPAMSPDKPAWPKNGLLIGGGILLGIIFAVGAAVMSIITTTVVLTEQGLEYLMGVPVLGSLPMVIRPERAQQQVMLLE